MLRKANEAVSEGNGPIPQQEEFGSGQPTLAGASREISEMLDEFHDDLKDVTSFRSSWNSSNISLISRDEETF